MGVVSVTPKIWNLGPELHQYHSPRPARAKLQKPLTHRRKERIQCLKVEYLSNSVQPSIIPIWFPTN